MTVIDKPLICRDCAVSFLFTVGEQEFYKSKGLQNEPQRCPTCRALRRQQRGSADGTVREIFQVTCSECGGPAIVPFNPRLDRPVYCSNCFEKVRAR